MENRKMNTEMFYIFGAMLLVGAKAVGLEERSWSFALLFLVGAILIATKMLFDAYTVSELILFGSLIGYGIYAYFNMGSLGLISLMILLVGMKDVDIKRLFKWISVEYLICFSITIILSVFGDRDGVELVHEKFGMILLRQSLGYTHPNVLHVTYVILMALILYTAVSNGKHGKGLWKIMILLLMGDAFIFMYSLSNTGLLMSFALMIAVFYMDIFHWQNGENSPVSSMERRLIYAWIPVSFFGFIILSRMVTLNNDWYTKANDIFNMRTWCINRYFDDVGLSLFGRELILQGVSLDNSYAYGLFAYGVVFITIAFIAYLFTCRYLIAKNRMIDLAIIVVLMFGGITEQFMFNASIKNLSIFMIGEWLFASRFMECLRSVPVLGRNIMFLSKTESVEPKQLLERSKILSYAGKAAVICAFIVLIGCISREMIFGRDPFIVYANPASVDVGMKESDPDSLDIELNDAYLIGNVNKDEIEGIYVFTDDNSAIIDQFYLYRRISIGCAIILIGAFGSWTVIRRRKINENIIH